MWGVGCEVWGLRFGIWGLGLGFGVWGVGCGVWGVGCGVWGLGLSADQPLPIMIKGLLLLTNDKGCGSIHGSDTTNVVCFFLIREIDRGAREREA